MWMTLKCLERSRMWLQCGRNWWRTWILTNPHHFLTMCIWDALRVNANRMKQSLNNIRRCSNHVFLLEQQRNYLCGRNLTRIQWRSFTTTKDMLKNALNDTANWRTNSQSSFTKFQVFAWMIINSRRRSLNQLGNNQEFAHIFLKMLVLGTNWTTWQSFGLWTNRQDQSQNGLKHVINDWQGWFHTFITQMTIVKIVMCERRHSIRLRLCWRSWGLKSQSQEVSCVLLEAEHLFQSVGCARNKRQFLIAPQNLKLFLWMLDYVWMGLLALDLWSIVIEVLRTNPGQHSTWSHKLRETWADPTQPNEVDQAREGNQNVQQLSNLDHVPTNTHSSQDESQLYIFEDNEPVIKMIIRGRSPNMRHVSRTHRVALDWLFHRINFEPQDPN